MMYFVVDGMEIKSILALEPTTGNEPEVIHSCRLMCYRSVRRRSIMRWNGAQTRSGTDGSIKVSPSGIPIFSGSSWGQVKKITTFSTAAKSITYHYAHGH